MLNDSFQTYLDANLHATTKLPQSKCRHTYLKIGHRHGERDEKEGYVVYVWLHKVYIDYNHLVSFTRE